MEALYKICINMSYPLSASIGAVFRFGGGGKSLIVT